MLVLIISHTNGHLYNGPIYSIFINFLESNNSLAFIYMTGLGMSFNVIKIIQNNFIQTKMHVFFNIKKKTDLFTAQSQ